MAVYEKSKQISFDKKEHLGVLRTNSNGWTREVNILSWNGGPDRLDIRDWNPDKDVVSKGSTFSRNEVVNLNKILINSNITLEDRPVPDIADIDDFTFNIVKPLGVLSTAPSGWTKEINILSWNNGPDRLDIREWDANHEKMSKGISFNQDEFNKFVEIISSFDIMKLPDTRKFDKSSGIKGVLHPVSAIIPISPELKTVSTANGDQKVCNTYVYIDMSGGTGDTKKNVPVQISAWGELAEELANNYKKNDQIQFLGKPTPITYVPDGSSKEYTNTGYKIVYISQDKTLINDYLKLQNQYLSDRLTHSRETRKSLDKTAPELGR